LTWDSNLGEWAGRSNRSDGTEFSLFVATPDYHRRPAEVASNPDRTVTEESRTAFRNIRRGDAHVRAKVAEKYVSRYSEWHDGESITPEDFQGRLQLDGIRMLPRGEAEITYLDDDMFYGHSLIAHLKADGRVHHIEMFG